MEISLEKKESLLQLKDNKKLFYLVPLNFKECKKKGNISYLRCFEIFFDRIYIIYFNSEINEINRIGKTIYIGIGGFKYIYLNIFFSPFLLWRLHKKINPDFCITTDVVFNFWSTLLLRFKSKYIFFPVCFVGEILQQNKPYYFSCKFLERIFIKLSLWAPMKICVIPPQFLHDKFWEQSKLTRNKLLKVSRSVEEYPTYEFMERSRLKHHIPKEYSERNSVKLVTISRLHTEKIVDQAIEAAILLSKKNIIFDFYIIGDGAEKNTLIEIVHKNNLTANIHFLGTIANEALVPYLQHADIYLSTLTGTALREAILCECPVISYKNPMTQQYFDMANIGFITSENTPEALANGVEWYINNPLEHARIKQNLEILKEHWSLESLKQSLEETFT